MTKKTRRRFRPEDKEQAVARPSVTPPIFETGKQRCRAPRIHADLRARGQRVSRKTVAALMKEKGVHPPRRTRRSPRTTDGRHSFAIAPDLLRRTFKVMAPDTAWLADVS